MTTNNGVYVTSVRVALYQDSKRQGARRQDNREVAKVEGREKDKGEGGKEGRWEIDRLGN